MFSFVAFVANWHYLACIILPREGIDVIFFMVNSVGWPSTISTFESFCSLYGQAELLPMIGCEKSGIEPQTDFFRR